MATSGDRSFIAFFTESKEREERRNSENGEVPDVFRTNYFHIGISGATLALPNPWRPIKLHAKLLTQAPGETEFVHRLHTEIVEGESSPKFTRRATFGAMTMNNSQNEAKRTLVKVDVYLYDDLVFSTKFQLSKLLWDTRIEKHVQPVIPNMVVVKNRKEAQGRLVVEVIRGRPLHSPTDNHGVVLNLGLSARVWAMISEHRIYIALCCVGFRGRWNRVYASENIKKPFMRNALTVFPRIFLARSVLLNDNPSNPIRIEMYGCRKGYPKLLGYCHVTLMDLDKPRDIMWNTGPSSALLAVMKVKSALVSQNCSEVNLCLEAGTATGREVHMNPNMGRLMPVDQDKLKTRYGTVLFPTALQNDNFQQDTPREEVHAEAGSTILTSQKFKVHFPAIYRPVLNEATDDNGEDFVCHSTGGKLLQRMKS